MFRRESLWKTVGIVVLLALVAGCVPAPTSEVVEEEVKETVVAEKEEVVAAAPEAKPALGDPVEPFNVMTMTATEDPRRFEISRLAVEAWQELGIPAELWPVASSVMVEQAWEGKKYHAYFIHHDPNPDRMEPDTWLYNYYHSSNAGPAGSNISGYQNPEYDALAEAQRSETDPAKRKELADKAQEWLYNAQPFHPFAHLHLAGVYNKDTFGEPTIFVGNPVYNFWSLNTFKPLADRKVLRVGLARDFETFNPMAASDPEDINFLSLIYDQLGRIGPDGAVQPWAAESIDAISPSEYEVTLREGMTWHDGQPVTAEDVAFTFNYAKEKKAIYFVASLQRLEKAEVVGPNKVRFTLSEPYVPFVANVLCQVFLLPKHIWEGIENPLEVPNDTPIGSGPWKFEYARTMEESMLVRFDDHFQPPVAEGLLHVTYGSVDGMLGAMEEGSIDTVGEILTVAQVEQLEGLPHIKVEKVVEFGLSGVYFNTRLEPFNDRIFRQALALSFPIDDIIKIVLRGAGDPAGSIIAPSLEYWHNDSLPPFPHDPERAKELLTEAGYTWDENGVLHYPTPENDKRDIDTGSQLY